MGLVTLSTGCGEAGDLSQEVARSAPTLRQALQPTAPATCQELKSVNPQAVDGEYVLSFNGNPTQPWTAWCRDMAGTPTEYLTLLETGTSNFSQYTAGWASPGTDVRTTYFKLRIDPATLRVNTTDQTFSSSSGVLNHSGYGEVRSMPYASAASCNWAPSGVANLDLRGTSFSVAANQFVVAGWNAVGETHYSADAQVVDLTGGGYCGSNSVTTSDGLLQLALKPLATCQELKSVNPQAVDGEYVLYLNGNPAQPWTAWCHDMAGTPTEYLTLLETGTSNFSQYTAGWASPGTDVRTTYFKLRIDPATLRVNTTDQTFSSSSGVLKHSGYGEVRSMPYASAASCNWAPSGVANLDLRGTSFSVAANQFSVEGWNAVGETHYSADARVVDLTGGGYCGSNSLPSGGSQLTLVYSP
ncbi:GON domain-containing protein [Archangium sp.]|uniref:GON domain-containing protein n=1 Tax=Archangium sp. TaxID=1872627 RepID=UPI00389B1C6E